MTKQSAQGQDKRKQGVQETKQVENTRNNNIGKGGQVQIKQIWNRLGIRNAFGVLQQDKQQEDNDGGNEKKEKANKEGKEEIVVDKGKQILTVSLDTPAKGEESSSNSAHNNIQQQTPSQASDKGSTGEHVSTRKEVGQQSGTKEFGEA